MNIWLKLLISILPTVVVAGGMSLWKKLRKHLYTKDVIPFLIIAIILFGVISFVYYCPMSVENAPDGATVNHLSIANKIEKIEAVTQQLNHPEIASQLLHGLVLVLLLLGFYFWFRSDQKRFEARVTQEKNAERRSVENTKNAEINRLQQDLKDEKQRVGNEAYAIWAENHAGASIAEGLGGLEGFCMHLIDIMKNRTLDGQPNGASALTITGIKLATNTPLLFSLQQGKAEHWLYDPGAHTSSDHWVNKFCKGFHSAIVGLSELKHFEWTFLYPSVIRSQLKWFPFMKMEEYEKWAGDHETFLGRINEALPLALRSEQELWSRRTSMIPLVTAIIDFQNLDETTISKVLVGLSNLVHSERSSNDIFKEADWQAEKFPWFQSSSPGIIEFFKNYHASLGYRDIELMQAIEKLLTQSENKNLDVVFHQNYDRDKHSNLGDFPEGLKPHSFSYVRLDSNDELESVETAKR
jgi:hypothetical protein